MHMGLAYSRWSLDGHSRLTMPGLNARIETYSTMNRNYSKGRNIEANSNHLANPLL